MSEKQYLCGDYYDYPLIIKKLLSIPLIESPKQEIVYAEKSRYTYQDLSERIHRLANGLASLKVKPGDTVAVMDYDCPRYLECFFAIPMMGAVIQTVNWRLSADQILYTLQHAEASALILHTDFFPIINAIKEKLNRIKTVVLITEDNNKIDPPFPVDAQYDDLIESASAGFDFPDFNENTKATTFYTTGTTGDPKGVYFSHRQIVLHTLATGLMAGGYHTICRFRSNDVYMPMTPMFHVHAWGYPYLSTVLGVKQVYLGKFEPVKALNAIKTEGVTFSHGVPTILQMVINAAKEMRVDLKGWKMVVGGSQLSRGLAKDARDLGLDIYSGYGMSETCPVISVALPKTHMMDTGEDNILDIITKTGKPIPLVEFEVVDAQDQPLPHDGHSTGEVVMRAPWLTQGYFKAPDKTKELWRNRWLHSGDVGHINSEGYLQITDRIKDVIKSGGEWISSLDLENLLSQHEAVMESAAIGIPDDKWGERPLVIVVLKPEFEDRITPQDLKQFMKGLSEKGKLPRYAIPDHYVFVPSIAKTSVGKLDKKTLRQNWEQFIPKS